MAADHYEVLMEISAVAGILLSGGAVHSPPLHSGFFP